MVSERSEHGGAAVSGSRFLTPAEARREAGDRVAGQRTLLALRIIVIIAAVVFVVMGMVTDPDIGGVESDSLRLLEFTGFTLLGVTGLIAAIVCRRPARRQVFWLTESIIAAGGLAILVGGIGLIGDLDAVLPTVVFAVAVVSGLTTLVLLYVWRAREPC